MPRVYLRMVRPSSAAILARFSRCCSGVRGMVSDCRIPLSGVALVSNHGVCSRTNSVAKDAVVGVGVILLRKAQLKLTFSLLSTVLYYGTTVHSTKIVNEGRRV